MPKVWLIRHGESEANAGSRTLDAASIGLTPRGHEQALAVSRALPGPPALVAASPYARALQSAEPTLERFAGAPLIEWPAHEFTFLAAHDYAGTTADQRRPRADEYWNSCDPHLVRGRGAESFADLLVRVGEVLRRIRAAGTGDIALFTHKKFMTALLWTLLNGAGPPSARRMRMYRGFDLALEIPNGAIVAAYVDGDKPAIGAVERAHLAARPGGEA